MSDRPHWVKRVLARAGAGLLILATVAAGDAVIRHTPDSDDVARPFVTSGRRGQPVHGPTFTATVLGVEGGTAVVDPRRTQYQTGGVWVLVTMRMTANTAPQRLRHTVVRDRAGRTFHASERFQQPVGEGSHTLQPGVTIAGEVLFEVPRDAAPGLVLRLSSESITDQRFHNIVEIGLDIDDAMVSLWLDQANPLLLDVPEVVA